MRLLFFVLLSFSALAQSDDVARRLYDAHPNYLETSLTQRRFKHADIVPLLQTLRSPMAVTQVGESIEKRAIYQVEAGRGPVPVLLWSQMHGDEPTATMALFDIFNFLQRSGDGFDTFRQQLLTKLTLRFVPMLNPDGAERYQRRNAVDIDLNRDALRLQSPEAKLLKRLRDEQQPLVGFNLHDQSPRYSVGNTGKQAVLSFLATAYDEDRNLNDVRQRSMQLIAAMNRRLQPFIPGQIARYDDEFEPRAFGDNIQKWGTTLILIESGGLVGDRDKQAIRRLNFVAILTALADIASESYKQERIEDYQAIPENGRALFDLLIRNATIEKDGQRFTVDVGINRQEVNDSTARSFGYKSQIDDLGDLSTFGGLEELDATGLTLTPARLHTDTLRSIGDLRRLPLETLRSQGVVVFKVQQAKRNALPASPAHLLRDGKLPGRPLGIGQIPTFLLRSGQKIRWVFVNGFGEELGTGRSALANGVVD